MGWVFCSSKSLLAWAIYWDIFILWSFLNDSFKEKDSVWQSPNKNEWIRTYFQLTQKCKYYVPDVKCSNFQCAGDILPQYFWYQSSHRPLPGTQNNFFPKMLMGWSKNSNFFSLRNTGPEEQQELNCSQSGCFQAYLPFMVTAALDRGPVEPQIHSKCCATSWSNFRKSRRHISSSGLFWKGTFSSSCRWNPYSIQPETGIVPSAALLVEDNAFCLLLSKLLKYNYTPKQHFLQVLQYQTRNPTPKSKHQTSSLKNENKFSNPKAVCFCDWKSFS